MDAKQASIVIDALADGVKSDPGQFTIQIKNVGLSIVSNGGIGLSVNVTGGMAGSKTIGNQVSVDGGNVELSAGRANAAMVQQMNQLDAALREISRQLKDEHPDKGVIGSIIESLQKSWVPASITAVVTVVTKSILGA
ncbi:hypothetical protein [Pseudomonas atacamensis]|uniref:hypothetical protein n=1 Tax=Pseudomonas atacamensis TaxID=2565368 RepID=UPI00300EB890